MSSNRFYINREGIHDNTIWGKSITVRTNIAAKGPQY